MNLPLVKKEVVWRVGWAEGAGGLAGSSMEGLGVSVSECPEAWMQIARLGDGDTWRLTPRLQTGVFLDVHAISQEQEDELTRVAIAEGLLVEEPRWKAIWAVRDEEDEIMSLDEDYEYSFFGNRRSAAVHARSMAPDGRTWRVDHVSMPVPTEKLRSIWAERFRDKLEDTTAAEVAWQVVLERDRPDLDGFWWNDLLDPDRLSAPRGMIFYSRIKNWEWKKSRPSRERMPNPDGHPMIGKRIGGRVYLHRSAVSLRPDLKPMIREAQEFIGSWRWDVVRVDQGREEVAFFQSPDFDRAPEPTVGPALVVNVSTGATRKWSQTGWIYHQKHTFVGPNYTGFDLAASRARTKRWEALGVDKSRIGRRDYLSAWLHQSLATSEGARRSRTPCCARTPVSRRGGLARISLILRR